MPISDDIAQDLSKKAKSIATKAMDSITPDFFVNLYHKIAKSRVSLTSEKEITGFKHLIEALSAFCDPSKPLNIQPEIANCWRVFTYTKVTETTYEFENPFRFIDVNNPYQGHQTIQGRTYWDCPFTSSILASAGSAPALKENSKQSLARLVFGYITSVAVVTSSLDTDNKKYEAIKHLNLVVNIMIGEEACRRLFDDKNTQALVQISNRISQYFSLKHAEREAAFIPKAVAELKQVSRELASQLFSIMLIATEGSNKKYLTNDYSRIKQGIITNELNNPIKFNPGNPFAIMLQESSKLMNAIHDEPNKEDVLKTLEIPEPMLVKRYLKSNLELAHTYRKSWFGSKNYSLMYFFMQKLDPLTQRPSWVEDTDATEIEFSVKQINTIARWLKFMLTIACVAKDLSLLLSMEGQKWLACGDDAQIIQQFIHKLNQASFEFKNDINALQNYLRGRIRSKCGFEHNIFHLVQKLDETNTLLIEKGVTPLLNIEEKYLVVAENVHAIRLQFFSRIVSVLNQSNLGFALRTPTSQPTTAANDTTHEDYQSSVLFSKKPPSPDKFLKVGLTLRLSNWFNNAFNTNKQEEFLLFWQQLLYVEKDHGLVQGWRLPKLCLFHKKFLHDIKKLEAQRKFTNELAGMLVTRDTAVSNWAESFVTLVYKDSLAPSTALQGEINQLTKELNLKNEAANKHLLDSLKITFEDTAWDSATYKSLKKTLIETFGMTETTASHFLIDIARQILQRDLQPNSELSEALDALLDTALNNLVMHADKKEQRDYWSDICRGLTMLGANPLSWMDARMADRTLVSEEDAHGFYLAGRQVTLILSATTYRARFLGDTSLQLKEKFDELVKATDAFGHRLYSCVGDDTTWWWVPLAKIGVPNYGGARIERATILWATVRWLYLSINEQLFNYDVDRLWTTKSALTMQSYEQASKQYHHAVPNKNAFFNQGFATWKDLDVAYKDYCRAIVAVASLRIQKQIAIELDAKKLEIATIREETTENNQKIVVERHLIKSLERLLSSTTVALTHEVYIQKSRSILEDVTDIHNIEPAKAMAKMNELILTKEQFLSLRSFVNRPVPKPSSEKAKQHAEASTPKVSASSQSVFHRKTMKESDAPPAASTKSVTPSSIPTKSAA